MDDANYPNIGWPTGTLFWNVDGSSQPAPPPDKRVELNPIWGTWEIMEIEVRKTIAAGFGMRARSVKRQAGPAGG